MSAPAALVERLSDLPSDSLDALVTESEQDGLRFLRRLVQEWASGANRFDGPGEALFAAMIDRRVIGVCGLNVDPYAAAPRVGRVRHLYVLSAYRQLGVGRQLVDEVIERRPETDSTISGCARRIPLRPGSTRGWVSVDAAGSLIARISWSYGEPSR